MTKEENTAIKGEQRLSLEKLRKWESLKYGMFIHFGMSTFDECELPDGNSPSTKYAPSDLDVAQWIRVAKEAGMKYAVLTTKHVAGHCLWPSEYTDYSVKTSSNTTDVVGAFVEECRKQGLMPGLYYCSLDNHTRLGSVTPSDIEDGYDSAYSEGYDAGFDAGKSQGDSQSYSAGYDEAENKYQWIIIISTQPLMRAG